MSIAALSISEGPLAGQNGAPKKGKPPPSRTSVAKADPVDRPDPR